ncbi:MAG: hypothetical protein ACPGYT_01760 [Nitrospirales bacterium]
MQRLYLLIFGILTLILCSCTNQFVPERLPVYFGVDKELLTNATTDSFPSTGVNAGLLVINDTSYPDSAPPLSQEGLEGFTSRLKAELGKRFPITLEKVINYPQFKQGQNSHQFVQVAQKEGLDYLLLAVISSAENEVPEQLSFQGGRTGLGGGRGRLLGFRAENYALVELALLNGKTGHPVVHANGTAWSVLERLNVPIDSNVYPVVRRNLTQPPIYPSNESAYDVLRIVSADDAMKQALMHFHEVWRKEPST